MLDPSLTSGPSTLSSPAFVPNAKIKRRGAFLSAIPRDATRRSSAHSPEHEEEDGPKQIKGRAAMQVPHPHSRTTAKGGQTRDQMMGNGLTTGYLRHQRITTWETLEKSTISDVLHSLFVSEGARSTLRSASSSDLS